jgi:hypothetical protein
MTTVEQRTMSGSELKVLLGGLGVPPSWLAARLEVTMRTVVRWFDCDAVSVDVMLAIDGLRRAAEEETMRLLKGIDRRKTVITLTTFRTDDEYLGHPSNPDHLPATWHRQVVFRLMEQLRGEGKTVTVQYG